MDQKKKILRVICDGRIASLIVNPQSILRGINEPVHQDEYSFSDCDLGEDYVRTELSVLVPMVPNLFQKILASVKGDPSLLYMGDWECGTSACLAGWAIRHAGEAGESLRHRFGYDGAGAMIFLASTGMIPDFALSDDEALEFLRENISKLETVSP